MLDKSQSRLALAHPLLRKLFTACEADPAIPTFTVLDSQRNRADQERAFALGHSRAHFGQSAHNWSPAVAVDVVPFAAGKAINWSDIPRFIAFGKLVTAKAQSLGIQISWGGTWKSIKDFPHYEMADWKALVASGKVKPYGA